MKFEREGNGFVHRDENGKIIAEITFMPVDEKTVIADHTFVDAVLRGQGVAEKLLDYLVQEMKAEGKQIKAQCSYVVKKFDEEPEKYDAINADK
ncbi:MULTISPECIES: GNAT family N-acetyltransferase [unclassified Facklamia]|uniref:GNAT family N-acetyltransferase n=1 Tax=Aerococcaceae TaxID=186827 RepID=UPI0013B8D583|nr:MULTISPECIES: GNAT family N-acetyltransferase [unclassified Facklamia]MBS4461620.1 N-acetyltransferase [Aerococcaceae bacterium zg-B36]NEW63912.1 GNAT family N-acetyltransferase [Facklamia sp. 252]NEW67383.1 GNAT family N-acetyltransferase [Facklamia sp. 253]QQD65259.1 N-acetyltransferase [Aerococcaceae bacterium zg-252]